MSARRPLAPALVPSVVAAATTWVALTAWQGFVTEPPTYLNRIAVVGAAVALLGGLMRWGGTPRWLVPLVQLAVAAAIVSQQVTGSPLPGAALGQALSTAVDSARAYSAPISAQVPPVWPLLVLCGAAFMVLVDTIACTFRRVPGAGLALLAIYSVPSGLLDEGPAWGSFVAATVGFLVLLHLDTREQVQRWGQTLGPEQSSPWGHDHPVREAARAGAGRIGITATALALVLPTFIPVFSVDLLDLGNGSGGDDIRIRKPIADMRRDLERGEDIPLIDIRTDDPDPSYLRVSVLNRFTGQEWSSGDRDVARDDTASGALPAPIGLDPAVPVVEYDHEVRINDDFSSTWLPTQFPVGAIVADGDWRYDPASMDFLAADDDLDTRGAAYSMTALEPDYGRDGRYFRDAATGAVGDEVLELPQSLPDIVRDLARSVTAPATNDYERALMLQRWFRQDGGFTYDLRRAPNGTGNGTLETFLSPEGRVGYCEQYASAMAVMARVLGIPARVAVGFLEPDDLGDGRWEYSSHDLHAWPELYFAGAGWVRFEPTPAGRAETVPTYTQQEIRPPQDDPTTNPTTDDIANPPRDTASAAPDVQAEDVADAEGGRSLPWVPVLVTLLVVALLVLVLLAPRTVRRRRRAARLTGGVEDAWLELRDTVRDLGMPWPRARSPRQTAESLVRWFGAPPDEHTPARPARGPEVNPDAVDALDRLVLALELSRYAERDPGPDGSWAGDVETCVLALLGGSTARVRRRAEWWPRSLFGRERVVSRSAGDEDSQGRAYVGVVDHVG